MKTLRPRLIWAMMTFLILCGTPSEGQEEQPTPVIPKKDTSEFSWEMPGRVSIYDLQFGPAVWKDSQWSFLGSSRTVYTGAHGDKLTLMIRFSYSGSKSDTPLKFVIKLPEARQYEETVHLSGRSGNYSYPFTLHKPEDFVGSGSIYLYYGFSIVDVLDFTIVPGSPQANL